MIPIVRPFKLKQVKGQTAMELAVFGSMIIFVVGLIIKQAVSNGYSQNFQLKAMRKALLTSCNYSGGCNPGVDSASRNSASVLFVQDRLTASSAKYGAVDRMPLMASASGTHSHNLFYPVEDNEASHLPYLDVYVNGEHFTFSQASYINWCLAETGVQCDAHGFPYDRCGLRDASSNLGGCAGIAQQVPWDANCATLSVPGLPAVQIGCPIVSEMIYNHDGFDYQLTADDRFDLDRDGTVDVPDAFRPLFAWQWDQRRAINPSENANVTLNPGRVAMKTGANSYIDIDGDNKEETLMKVQNYDGRGLVIRVRVIDYQEGDMDTSVGNSDPEPAAGFNNNVQLYTFLKDRDAGGAGGTYALVEEGKLYAPDRQYIRTTRRKDSIDIIQREFQLHNTERLCPTGVGAGLDPVDYCRATRDECFKDEPGNRTVYKNCIWMGTSSDPTSENYGRILFIRSRIQDLHGRKWITDVTDDTNITLDTPGL